MNAKIVNHNAKSKSRGRDVWAMAGLTLLTFLGVSAFISVYLGVFLAGAMSLGYGAVKEYKRRQSWENTVDYRINRLSNDVERLDFDTTRNSGDIKGIKNSVSMAAKKMRVNVAKGATSYQTLKSLSEDLEKAGKRSHVSALSRVQSHKQRQMNIRKHRAANDMNNTYVLDNARNRAMQNTLKRALDNHKVRPFTQPIVELQNRTPMFQEVFSRIQFRDDAYMPAGKFLSTAKQNGSIAAIDSMSLNYALAHLQKLSAQKQLYFINISTHTLKSGRFMSTLLRVLSSSRSLAPYVIFEIQQADFETIDAQSFDVLKGLSALGCGISIDHVRDLDLSLELVSSLNVRFVKLSAHMLKDIVQNQFELAQLKDLKNTLKHNSIDVIVERVESEKDLQALSLMNFKYGQGYLFSRPILQKAAA